VVTSPASSQTPAGCTNTARSQMTTIIHRIYDQAVRGRTEASAVKRIGRSTKLARAVGSGRPAAVRAVLAKLIKSQITRISVFTPNGRIAQIGSIPSYAPRFVVRSSSPAARSEPMCCRSPATHRSRPWSTT
jgi:hypothetical protein